MNILMPESFFGHLLVLNELFFLPCESLTFLATVFETRHTEIKKKTSKKSGPKTDQLF